MSITDFLNSITSINKCKNCGCISYECKNCLKHEFYRHIDDKTKMKENMSEIRERKAFFFSLLTIRLSIS